MSPAQLVRLARYLPAVVGVGLILVGVYAAGGVETTCTRADGRVGCRMETMRWFGLVDTEHVAAEDVIDSYVRRTTSSADSRTPAGALTSRTQSNNTVVLATRGGGEIDAFGATTDDSYKTTDRLEEFLKDESRRRLFLFSSDWPFGIAACAFGLVWIGIGAVVIRVVNRGG